MYISPSGALVSIKSNSKTETLIEIGRKHCRRRIKCWLPAFYPVPIMFQYLLLLGVVIKVAILCLTPPKRQILDSSKLKEVADDNFKFDESGRKL